MNLSHHGGSCGHSCCLRVENMSVKIGTDCILKDVNLHVHCGEMAAIIGPNGVKGKVPVELTYDEQAKLRASADALKEVIASLDI